MRKRPREVSIEQTTHRLNVGLHGSVNAAAMADVQALDGGVDVDNHSTTSSLTGLTTTPGSTFPRTASSCASAKAQPGIHASFGSLLG